MYLRWPSAKIVSNASVDLPLPLRPVMTTSWSRGISTEMFLRLCSRAPRMRMDFWVIACRVQYGRGAARVLTASRAANGPLYGRRLGMLLLAERKPGIRARELIGIAGYRHRRRGL